MHYKIFIDGEEKLNVVNEKPQLFTNVKIFASDEWHGAADAEYKNLCFENIDEEEHRGKVKVKKIAEFIKCYLKGVLSFILTMEEYHLMDNVINTSQKRKPDPRQQRLAM